MFTKEWKADFEGHQILARNSWDPTALTGACTTARLYIDGECVDSSDEIYSSEARPLLRGQIVGYGRTSIVEVFVTSSFLTVKGKICINGEPVAGDFT